MLIKDILMNLRKPVANEVISVKRVGGSTIKYISWPDLADLLDIRAGLGNWHFEILSVQVVDCAKKKVIVTGKLTLVGDDRQISFTATGEELTECSSYGDTSSNASAQAFRRACGLAGLGRILWQVKNK